MKRKEIYFSVDIEADGPIPPTYSMLSFAAVAFEYKDNEINIIGDKSYNLIRLFAAKQHPNTMKFWARFPEAYAKTRKYMVSPIWAMPDFAQWVEKISGEKKAIFIGYPATYDFKWMDYYFYTFVGKNPFGFSALDMKSYASAILEHHNFSSTSKASMPKKWFKEGLPHTHVALDDALEQAHLFCSMKRQIHENGS